MKKLFFFLTMLVVLGCNSTEIIDNQKLIDSIDKLEVSQKIIELNISAEGVVIDTSAIFYEKMNFKGQKVFEKSISLNENWESISEKYFTTEEDLFYRRTEALKGEYKTIYQTIRNEKEIVSSLIVNSEDFEKVDTIVMDYNYEVV